MKNNFFVTEPSVNIPRSMLPTPFTHKTTFNAGKLVPIYTKRMVLPGDTISVKTAFSIRMSTPIVPVMDEAYADIYYFAVPYRLVFDKAKNFFGESTSGKWDDDDSAEVQMPHLHSVNRVVSGSVLDYLGVRPGLPANSGLLDSDRLSVNACLPRAVALIWNEYFRSGVTDTECYIPKDGADRPVLAEEMSGVPSEPWVDTLSMGGALPPVSKYHTLFTSALPEPQRGQDVFLPLGISAPVTTGNDNNFDVQPMPLLLAGYDSSTLPAGQYPLTLQKASSSNSGTLTVNDGTTSLSPQPFDALYPTNLVTDLSKASSVNINQVREAFALQSFFEKDARYGFGRYTEIVKGHFGVTSPDARLQRPEFLAHRKKKINMQQVLQTSASDSTSPQGHAAAYSWTMDVFDSFTYSATEHCILLGFICVRSNESYQYALHRDWLIRDRTDVYWPSFDRLGEMGIYNAEIFPTNTAKDKEIFGYNEAWYWYRNNFNMISGAFRSDAQENVGGSLDYWHYSEKYDNLPTLSSEFLHQSKEVFDRSLAVQSDVAHQFLADFYFDEVCVRPMSVRSIPGIGSHF